MLVDKFEDAKDSLTNLEEFIKVLIESHPGIAKGLAKPKSTLTIYKGMLTLLITGFFSEDDDLRRKNHYLKAVRIPITLEHRINVYYAIMKWLVEKNCLFSMSKLLGDYTKLKTTDDMIGKALNEKHLKDIDSWKTIVHNKTKDELEDFI